MKRAILDEYDEKEKEKDKEEIISNLGEP